MRVRGIVGGVLALAFVAAPGALAQEPAGTVLDSVQEATGERQRGAAPADLNIRVQGVHGKKVKVGNRVQAVGRVRPFVPDQNILLLVKRGNKTVKRKLAPLRQVGNQNVGEFELRLGRMIKPGSYRVRASKPETPEQDKVFGGTGTFTVDYPDLDPGDNGSNVKLLNKLLGKQAYHTSNGTSYGSDTGRAVLAFRKVNNMARTTNATPGIFKTLAAGKGGFHLKWPGGGKHIEADLSRQVMVLADDGEPKHIFHISSGTPATPTIRGKFATYRKDYGTNSIGMIHSVYFIRGYATHGYHSVPTYPASHGCLRNPPADSLFIYNWIDMGDVFYVYG